MNKAGYLPISTIRSNSGVSITSRLTAVIGLLTNNYNTMNNNNDSAEIMINNTSPFGSANGKQTNSPVTEDSSVSDIKGNTDNADATVFIDDGTVVKRDESHVAHIDDTIMNLNDTNFDEQSIKSFLGRPIVFQQGLFNVTDTYSVFNSYSMPYTALQATQAVMWREKLAGIFGIRMDMRFRIVVNANRFQQGRYIMGWVPLASPYRSTSSLKELAFVQSHMASLVQRTTVPHVEIDLNADTTAELLVPFVSCRNFYPLSSILSSVNNYPLGYLNIYPYSPMVSPAGSTTAGYTLYVSFENIRLFGAASAQSGVGSHKKDVREKEVSNTVNGPISSVSSALSKGFKEFGHIPMLSTYANTISWVADRVTSVASVFGWSKPMQGDSLTKFVQLVAANHNTVDGDSDARPMSYLSKPGVVAIDGISGTDYDEMDFSYVARKPAWFSSVSWATSSTSGTLLSTFDVTAATTYSDSNGIHYTPVSFVSSFFNAWRGSLRYRLKFVKTEFHSGRLSISFFPATNTSTFSALSAYVHRLIVDIRTSQEVDFVVPYISDAPWSWGKTGVIVIEVIDPLVSPATVSSAITILMEICAGEDFEVAIPGPSRFLTPRIAVPQSGLSNDSRLLTMDIGNSTVAANPNVSSAIAIGDKVSSFRSFLKRYTPVRRSNVTAIPLNVGTFSMRPDVIIADDNVGTNIFIADHYSLVASCYAMVRGGVRVRDIVNTNMLTDTANKFGPQLTSTYHFNDGSSVGFDTNPINMVGNNTEKARGCHTHFQDLMLNSVVSIEMPQYTQTLGKSTCDLTWYQGAYGTAYGYQASATLGKIVVAIPETRNITVTAVSGQEVHNIFRSLADDADFSCFISVPCLRTGPGQTDPRSGLA